MSARLASPKRVPPNDVGALDSTRKVFGSVAVPSLILKAFFGAILLSLLVWTLWNAFRIRTYALKEYGMVIHEFDPWFNFRATQYLSDNGWHAFFHWFDYMVWYPLGRPVGTTIYPGLQITAVAVHRALEWLGGDWVLSLNDVCCYIPCWGGATATFFLALLTYEASASATAAVVSACVMAVVPAHMMRSVGGGYDNESIAMTAIIMTFYFWVRSLRTKNSWPFGILTGLAYGYMVAAWGGFIFVLNMIALHAAMTLAYDAFQGKYSTRLHRAYSLFFIIGTAIAVCVPPVGMAPFKSLEQLFGLLVFIVLQLLWLCEKQRLRRKLEVASPENWRIRLRVFAYAGAAAFVLCSYLAIIGWFGPLSSRVRGLFVQHTRTGNPLVDSVAEHQPANNEAYWHYLHLACFGWGTGIFVLPIRGPKTRLRAVTFLLLYAGIAYHFSMKMARLILLTAPIASCLTGVTVGYLIEWCFSQLQWSAADEVAEKLAKQGKNPSGKLVRRDDQSIRGIIETFKVEYDASRAARIVAAITIILVFLYGKHWRDFNGHAERMAVGFSNPQLMWKSQTQDGKIIIVDDYREAYFWLRDRTPKDSRVMAWWDYGYQITGIGERTSIADGNTWNHEHIATLGKCLTSPVKESHMLIRHLADYVLVWAGGGGDDLGKSPHMARIGNSVYRDICPDDPLCAHFGFHDQGHKNPTPMMRASLLYNLHAHNVVPGVQVDPAYFQEAYTSKYGLIRIFKVMNVSQESKDWVADPENRVCNPPDSWICSGLYPPAEPIQALLRKRRDFGQYEDFNKRAADDDYYKKYMQRMGAYRPG